MKKSVFILIIFSLLFPFHIIAQDYIRYYSIINSAEINFLDKNYMAADSLYEIAFSQVKKPFKEDYLKAAINAEKLGNSETVFDYLINGIRHGVTIKRIKKSTLDDFKATSFYRDLKARYDVLHQEYLKSLNIPLKNQIDEMIKNDQRVRKSLFAGWRKMKKVDDSNFETLMELIKKNNNKWIGFSLIGENTPKGKYDVTGNIALMLLHFKKNQIEQLKEYMFQAVLSGEMYPYHYARIMDYKNSCQVYGTYIDSDFFEICDCEMAEKNRKIIGLEPIEDYYRKRNSSYKCKK